MRTLKSFCIFMLFLALIMTGACSKTSALEVGQAAPDFSLNDIDGKMVSLSNHKGKIIILDFFATWCPPCRREIPDFVELQKFHGAEKILVIGISKESPEELKEFANEMDINYPILVDRDEKVHVIYGPIRGIPTTFVIDEELKIQRHYIGAKSKEVFENDIKELLK